MMDYIYEQAKALLDAVRNEASEQGLMPLLEPVAPFNQSRVLLPAVLVGSQLSLMLLSGVAIGAFAALFGALLGLYLLLSEVFGISLELESFPR